MLLLIVGIILLGGATRLTNSGLSITEWRLVSGALPPLSDAEWVSEFEKYRQIPEFTAEHPDMELDGFRFIYFMEWSHRQLGRLIGISYLLPLCIFLSRGRLAEGQRWRFILILFLIGFQGFIGWWMVTSGLANNRVDVSQYRLAAHLGMAFLILGCTFWLWRDIGENWPKKRLIPRFKNLTTILFLLIFLQILTGAFVAGTHAGLSYNTWPLMDGKFIPDGYFVMDPKWVNPFENVVAIQFNHRVLGYLVLVLSVAVRLSIRRHGDTQARRASGFLLLAVLAQIGLGIATLLGNVPIALALAHQGLAVIVFLLALSTMRAVRISRF